MKKIFFSLLCIMPLLLILSCDNKYELELKKSEKEFSEKFSEKIKKINLNDTNFIKFFNDYGLASRADFKAAAITDPTAANVTDPIKYEILAKSYIAYSMNSKPIMRGTIQAQQVDIDPTNSVWIDKEAIKAFAKEMVDDPNVDGIRVYYARYLDFATALDPSVDPRFNSRETLIFVATTPKDNGRFKYHKDYYNMPGSSNSSLYIYDYNSLCPPMDTCQGATLGGFQP